MLILEVMEGGEWTKVFSVEATEKPGALPNSATGERVVFLFQVLPSRSVIYRPRGSLDTETESGDRIVAVRGGLDIDAVLVRGQELEFDLQTDAMPSAVRARFRQE